MRCRDWCIAVDFVSGVSDETCSGIISKRWFESFGLSVLLALIDWELLLFNWMHFAA